MADGFAFMVSIATIADTLRYHQILVLQHPAESKDDCERFITDNAVKHPPGPPAAQPPDVDLVANKHGRSGHAAAVLPGPVASPDAPQLSRPMLHGDHRSKASSPSHVSSDSSRGGAVRKVVLVLIDGTWTQARHMMRHSPELASACTRHTYLKSGSIPSSTRCGVSRAALYLHLEACARALRLVEATEQAAAAADHMERALKAIVAAQLSMVGFTGSQPRFVDRKRRTWNRKLYRSDGPPRASPGALTSAPASAPQARSLARSLRLRR